MRSIDSLTDRQRACLRLIYQRYQIKEIAERLGISPDVVKQHLAAARERLGGLPTSMAAARLLAEQEGLPPSLEGGTPASEVRGTPSVSAVPKATPTAIGSALSDSQGVRPYFAETLLDYLPVPTTDRLHTALGWRGKLFWGLAIAFLSVALVGAFKSLLS